MDSVKVLSGNEVIELLEVPSFCTDWDQLFYSCAWATAFQSRGFVSNWYKYNQEEFFPIMVIGTSLEKMTGLLTLAIPAAGSTSMNLRNNRTRIVGAGGYEAEYQTWISKDNSTGDEFIVSALEALFEVYPKYDLVFRFIPSLTPLNWLNQSAKWNERSILQPYRRPLMEMKNPEFLKIFKKRGFKLKLNRLKRLGKIEFKKITSLETFKEIIDELIIQFDFRQGAMFDKISYLNKPHKRDFMLALFKEDLLHTTVLYLENKILASIIAIKTDRWVHLGGINTHTPFYAAHSPGFVHFILLGEQLVKDDMNVFDLTPGGDAYKERMATSSDQVFELLVTQSHTYLFKRKIKKKIQDYLVSVGRRPMSIELSIRKQSTIFKNRLKGLRKNGILNFLSDLKRKPSIIRIPDFKLFAYDHPETEIMENSLEDLLKYPSNEGKISRWEFLESAMSKFEIGYICYSWANKNVLLGLIWIIDGEKLGELNVDGLEKADWLLNDLYFHDEINLDQFLKAVFYRISQQEGIVDLKYMDNHENIQRLQNLCLTNKALINN
ncbi:GNAT family N-acetyltransferase [Lunatibacter salilacus]|uniref:GNAT family N-acetyltransferase n=1 Tax=Lunatibacter salilacus TaxID=2483804 RepID=UPI00131EAD82|nr:GNAT family N-acetyltransferase [Lunatibacter salilacus]